MSFMAPNGGYLSVPLDARGRTQPLTAAAPQRGAGETFVIERKLRELALDMEEPSGLLHAP
jgi:hypothetical protein